MPDMQNGTLRDVTAHAIERWRSAASCAAHGAPWEGLHGVPQERLHGAPSGWSALDVAPCRGKSHLELDAAKVAEAVAAKQCLVLPRKKIQ